MYVTLGGVRYDAIRNLRFDPEIDVTCSTVPTNEISVDVLGAPYVYFDWPIALYDDNGNRWCEYRITSAERVSADIHHVVGKSYMSGLDGHVMPATMYDGTMSAYTAIWQATAEAWVHLTSVDESLQSVMVRGFAPKQTSRERLQWLLMVSGGAYVQDFFTNGRRVKVIDDDEVGMIPLADTYWRPTVTHRDYVTAVRVTYYEYEQGMPSRTDDYVEVNGTTYIQTEAELTLTNPNVPSGVNENVVEVNGVTLINEDNVDDVLSFLAKYHFERTEIDLACIDNGDWYPGQRVYCLADEGSLYSGYINRCSFTFGAQAKADVYLTPTEARSGSLIQVNYMFDGRQVAHREYFLPVGYEYEIGLPYVRVTIDRTDYVLRPLVPTASGTVPEDGYVHVTDTEVALACHDRMLEAYVVDGLRVADGTLYIE